MEITIDNIEKLYDQVSEKLHESIMLVDYGFIFKNQKDLYHRDFKKFKSEDSVSTLNYLIKQIPIFIIKPKSNSLLRKNWNIQSYGAKHILERENKNEYCGGYSNNGQFIFAMLLLGYELEPNYFKRYSRMSFRNYDTKETDYVSIISPNPIFNGKYRDFNKTLCDCGGQYISHSKKQHESTLNHNLFMKEKEKEF